MGKLEDTKRLIDEAKTKLGGVDHLILNHITSNYMKLWDGDFNRLQNVIDVNFRAYVSLATYATPMLNESNGSIAVVSSFAGILAKFQLLSHKSKRKFVKTPVSSQNISSGDPTFENLVAHTYQNS